VTLPVIVTDRLTLRGLQPTDGDALHGAYSDVAANRYGAHPPTTTIEESRAKVARSLTDPHWRTWAITLTGQDRAIGTVGSYEKRQGKVSEIGYMLDRAHWGSGIASEATAALIDLLFAEGQRRVFADTDPDNLASIRVVERLGFTREARLRAEWDTHIGVRDSLIFGLLRDEWLGKERPPTRR
jgi:[ribosomal protein S5]-alanine N-acetyltransferase